jgi:EAL domain-containing protein (putative c-di-GMP-specific phosphodiesterase class I)
VRYQPIVSVTTGHIVGFEALARWRHPVRGLVNPAEFIPVAEDTGMIRHIGRIILAESCRRMADWQARLGAKAPAIMCVNVSSRQLAQADLAEEIETVMRETGVESSWLKLEITESAFITDIWAAEATLRRMQRLGVEWSLDDFGTGYSSLSYLHRLQADTVKVDRSFVSRMSGDQQGSDMVRAIVALAHNLGMDVVAEGVETEAQLAQLEAIGCEYAQGFYFSKPVDAVTAEALIHAEPWRVQGAHALAHR